MNLKQLFLYSTNNTFLQFFRYLFVGGFAFVFDFGFLYILTEYAHLHYLLSAILSFTSGLIINYLLSTLWVFSKNTVKNKKMEFLIFTLIGLVGLVFNTLFLWIFTDLLEFYYLVSKVITTILVYFWNFFARKYILFN